MRAAVVVPCNRAGSTLAPCLDALAAAEGGPYEIIVVDDASPDGVAGVAQSRGARCLGLERSSGAAVARNAGAAATTADIIIFVDADVRVGPEALARLVGRLGEEPSLGACFGLYSETCGAPGLVSDFRNLLHRYTHLRQTGRDVSSFFTAIGATRRQAFLEVGGLPPLRMLEDVVFGERLVRAGYRLVLEPEAEGCHLKRYGLGSMLRSLLFDRALPWGRLAATAGPVRDEFATSRRDRWASVLALAATLAGVGLLANLGWAAGLAGVAALSGLVLIERDLYGYLAARRGRVYLGAALPLHLVYLVIGGIGFGLGYLLGLGRGRPTGGWNGGRVDWRERANGSRSWPRHLCASASSVGERTYPPSTRVSVARSSP